MKNLILFASLFLIFSCGNGEKSNTPKKEIVVNQAPKDASQELVNQNTTPAKPEGNPDLAENTPSENPPETKIASTESEPKVEAVASKTQKKVLNKTSETNKENPDVQKILEEEQKKIEANKSAEMIAREKAAEEARQKKEIEARKKAAAEALKRKEAEARKKAEVGGLFGNGKGSTNQQKDGAGVDDALKNAVSHEAFDQLLKKYVNATGQVDYKNFKKEEGKLDGYLSALESTKMDNSWGRNKKMAFWINAYNAYTIKLILKNYPVKSITDLHGGKPWDVKWIKLDGRTLSLNNIENDILRPVYKDPRIHFAVNCAAKSCPPLLNQAWTASNLISNFEKQTQLFINNSKYNSISSKSAEVSKIFDWYGEDFGNLVDYLNQYSTTKIAAGTNVKFKEYDWALNN